MQWIELGSHLLGKISSSTCKKKLDHHRWISLCSHAQDGEHLDKNCVLLCRIEPAISGLLTLIHMATRSLVSIRSFHKYSLYFILSRHGGVMMYTFYNIFDSGLGVLGIGIQQTIL